MTKEFQESLSLFKDKISDCIKSNKSISITTHNDCDGLTSGSIITKALIREGAKCTIRTSKEFSKNVIQSLKTDSRDFHIITDLGGTTFDISLINFKSFKAFPVIFLISVKYFSSLDF